MKSNLKFFKKSRIMPVDKFFYNVLYDKKFGYYASRLPFGKKGDFITSPRLSPLFCEMIAIWIISFWQNLGSPKNFNLIELGAGNGEMMKILIESFQNFPNFFNSCNIFIHEKSKELIKIQKKNYRTSTLKKIEKDKLLQEKIELHQQMQLVFG